MLREVDGAHTSHPTAAPAAGSLTSTGTRCQSSYQVCAQPIAALPVWVVMVVLAGGGGGGCWPLLRGTLPCPARPAHPCPLVRLTRDQCLPDRLAESGQPAERLRRQHLSQQMQLPPLQTAGDGTAGSSRDMCVLPQLPLCCCDSPSTHERAVARRPLLYSLLEPSTRGAPDAQPPQAAQKGASQGFRADGTAVMRTDAGAASRGFDPAPFCFTTESQ